MFVIEFIAGIAIVTFFIVFYVKWLHTYWSRKKVSTIKIPSLFQMKDGLSFTVRRCYDEIRRRKEKHGGIYLLAQPIYVPVDTDIIKNILTRDFTHFMSHGLYIDEKVDPLSAHLFHLEGEKWKNMRVKLTPTFTSGKMKMMFQTLLDCGGPMIDHVDKISRREDDLDIKEILACYTTDVIGSCAFGLECNSFKDPDAEFRRYGRKVFEPSLKRSLQRVLLLVTPSFIVKNMRIKRTSSVVETFFLNVIKNIMDYRITNGVRRNDFIQMFVEMQENAERQGAQGMTLKEIAAQAFVFFLAGFETSSTTMTFCLHELAFNQVIQDKLREEVKAALKSNGGVLTYDAITEMKYMDKVLNETLRKFPPATLITRECNLDYKVPDSDFMIKEGTKVFISALGLHRDPEYYPKPEIFDPERFTEENKASRPAFAFLPFGEGPRICIGLRFGLMQAKTGLSMLLDKYKILPGKGERYDMEFDPKSVVLSKNGPVMLKAEILAD